MEVPTNTRPLLDFEAAAKRLHKVINRTPLTYNSNLSRKYQCDVYLKREDLQIVRSYKLRGAYNMMSSLSDEDLQQGVVTASAGNHAQGIRLFLPEIEHPRCCVYADYHAKPKG